METIEIGPNDALIAVDVQNDFCPGGALGVKEGDEVVAPLNTVAPLFDTYVATRDWHPPDHCSFAVEPQFIDKSWPVHCVANTPGAEWRSDLKIPAGAIHIHKGTERDREAYSGFQGTDLHAQLQARGVRRVFIGGLATDYCVRATALDAMELGYEVVLLADACRGVDIPMGSAQNAIEDVLAHPRARVAVTSQLTRAR